MCALNQLTWFGFCDIQSWITAVARVFNHLKVSFWRKILTRERSNHLQCRLLVRWTVIERHSRDLSNISTDRATAGLISATFAIFVLIYLSICFFIYLYLSINFKIEDFYICLCLTKLIKYTMTNKNAWNITDFDS